MKRLVLAFALLIASSFAFAAVNINTATKEQLDALPGIGPVKAQAIIDYRNANGPFKSPEDVMKVRGIKQGEFGKIRDQISVSGATAIPAQPAREPAKTAAPATRPTPAAPSRAAAPASTTPAATPAAVPPAAATATAPAAGKITADEQKAARAKAREEKAAKAKEQKEAKAKEKAEKAAKAKEEKAAKAKEKADKAAKAATKSTASMKASSPSDATSAKDAKAKP
jgi:competence protein ComEA